MTGENDGMSLHERPGTGRRTDVDAPSRWVRAGVVTVGFVVVLYVLEAVDQLTNNSLDPYGIQPRSEDGLVGIALAPLLHGSWGHLEGNTVPVLVLGFPLVTGSSTQLKGVYVACFVLVAVSIVVLTGWSGQVSLGQMSFAAVGAVVGAQCAAEWNLDLSLALLLSGVALPPGLDALGLRIVHPDAASDVLLRLGSVEATPLTVLADPAVRAAVGNAADAPDPAALATAVLGLVAAAEVAPGELPWLAALPLPDDKGELVPAGDLGIGSPGPWDPAHFQAKTLRAWRPEQAGPFRYAPAFERLDA